MVQKANVRVRFDSVPEDSRCPKDVHCIAAGNARVRLEITVGSAAPSVVELNTTKEPREAQLEGFRIVLADLTPRPIASQRTPEKDFLVTLSVLRT